MGDCTKKFLSTLSKIWNKDNDNEDVKWEKSYPEWKGLRERTLKNWKNWLEDRKREEGAEDLWRIHDNLYDLEPWIRKHPGGRFWIEMTKGTDITESFESHHISMTAEALLPNYLVREAKQPRSVPFTFHPEGFYRTLKNRVRQRVAALKKGPAPQSKYISDVLAFTTFLLSVLSAYLGSWWLCFPAGLFLTFTVVSAHNFFHQRDNWRMYYFNLSLMSFRDWRVSHAMSHHLYPNTFYDLEVSMFEPLFQWLPKPDKTFFARYVSWIYAPVVYSFIYHIQFLSRILTEPDGLGELVPLMVPGAMALSLTSPLLIFLQWNLIIIAGSFCFGCIGLNAAHHHPDLFHDGDKPRQDKDWGLYQLDAVRDRVEVRGIYPLVLTLFGDHSLHHLFPTLDHWHLDRLYPILEETCKEFGYHFRFTSMSDLIIGQFRQLARVAPNIIEPSNNLVKSQVNESCK